MKLFWKSALVTACIGAPLMIPISVKTAHADTFSIGPNDFLRNGKPYVILSGEMHFNRVPKE